jgi:soluble lytic murein transglycosylase
VAGATDGTTVRQFVGEKPISSLGRLALARVLMSEGDRDGAARVGVNAELISPS